MEFQPDKNNHLAPQMETNFTGKQPVEVIVSRFNPEPPLIGFTALAEEFQIDLMFCGHVHIYQRFLPLLGPSEHAPYQKWALWSKCKLACKLMLGWQAARCGYSLCLGQRVSQLQIHDHHRGWITWRPRALGGRSVPRGVTS